MYNALNATLLTSPQPGMGWWFRFCSALLAMSAEVNWIKQWCVVPLHKNRNITSSLVHNYCSIYTYYRDYVVVQTILWVGHVGWRPDMNRCICCDVVVTVYCGEFMWWYPWNFEFKSCKSYTVPSMITDHNNGVLRSVLAPYGLPEQVVADNRSKFNTSREFADFLYSNPLPPFLKWGTGKPWNLQAGNEGRRRGGLSL